MNNFNKFSTNLLAISSSLAVTLYLFVPPVLGAKFKYPLLAFPFSCFVFSSLLLGYYFFSNILKFNVLEKNHLLNSIKKLKEQLSINHESLFLCFCISIAFFLLYLALGLVMMGNTGVPNAPKLDLFGADIEEWINLQYFRDGYKPAHTNILLIVQPLEFLLGFYLYQSLFQQ